MIADLDELMGTAPVKGAKVECPSPGIYKDIPADTYFSWDAVSSTFIKAFADNPYKAKYSPFKGSRYTEIGHECHSFSLEGVPPEKYPEEAQGVNKSLRSHPIASQMLNRGCNEMSLVWVDQESGLTCKARLDDYFEAIPSDLKTCSDVTWFHRDLYKKNYHLQAGHYTSGCRANALPVDYFCFLAAQTKDTFPVRVGFIKPERLELAILEVGRLLVLIKECQERNQWPNFKIPEHVMSLDQLLPSDLLEEW